MTQNNERELLVKIKYAICMAIYSDDGLDGLEGENLMKEIDKYLSPISQNEQQEASLKVYHGEICYKSHADDQSYGMWCPVGYDTTQLYREGTEFYTSPPKQIPDGWISVKDRLPEVDQYCLYYAPIFEQKNAWSNVWAGIYDGNGNFSSRSGFLGGQEVTHWMPLQEAPTTSLTSETNTEVGK